MRRLFRHRSAIGVSAIVLAVAIGAVAWAMPGDRPSTEPIGPLSVAGDEGELGFAGWGHGRRGIPGGVPDELEERMDERRALREQRRDAFLDLVREKMSAEDQAALDELTGEAEQQRDALEQARRALIDTERQIRDLVGEYFPLDGPHGDAPTEEGVQ